MPIDTDNDPGCPRTKELGQSSSDALGSVLGPLCVTHWAYKVAQRRPWLTRRNAGPQSHGGRVV